MFSAQDVRTGRRSPVNRWWVVGGMGLAVFLASLDMSIVNVALPAIRDSLSAPTAVTQWVVLGYLLPLVALALPTGRWLDDGDHRSVFTWSSTGFAVASLAAGLAPTIGWLIAARVVQGLFGAALMALIPVLITTSVEPGLRGRAMGVVDTLGMLGLISGPAIGGVIVASAGWPWIFYLNVPVCIGLVLLALAHIPRAGRLRPPGRAAVVEAGFLAGSTTAIMLALTLATGGQPQWLFLALVAVPLLLIWPRLPASVPVRTLLTSADMRAPLAALAATSVASGLIFYIVPFLLVTIMATSAPLTGITMLAFPLGAAALGPFAGLMADRYGPRRTTLFGLVVLTGGLLLLLPADPVWSARDVAWRLAVAGAGIGLFNAPNMSAAMSAAPHSLLGTAGAATSVARQGGFAFGPAVATLVWGLSGYGAGGIRYAFLVASVVVVLGALPVARRSWQNRRPPVRRTAADRIGASIRRRNRPSEGDVPAGSEHQ
ncbi:MFS transporter [Micromonospora sp. C95]|uniref:MFS transporter n=1 Tax=Micromonospora sp. C95 TaxID=2824882 RepID=UPI001B37F10D|nr:MFS transporter [Micromonospora sp. C95]MBQ1023705.1 MFS transporter [Micromonospora sp. C95]